MKEIKGKVVSYCDIPEWLTISQDCWFKDFPTGCYIEYSIDKESSQNNIDYWLMEKYPGIENETFYIEIDY